MTTSAPGSLDSELGARCMRPLVAMSYSLSLRFTDCDMVQCCTSTFVYACELMNINYVGSEIDWQAPNIFVFFVFVTGSVHQSSHPPQGPYIFSPQPGKTMTELDNQGSRGQTGSIYLDSSKT